MHPVVFTHAVHGQDYCICRNTLYDEPVISQPRAAAGIFDTGFLYITKKTAIAFPAMAAALMQFI
jgi:hypothetical protein